MSEADYILVPRHPTEAMLKAGCVSHPTEYGLHTTLVDIIRAEWVAMVAAAPELVRP